MTAVTAEQLAAILESKLEEKLAPLNSTIIELKSQVAEVLKHANFIDEKYEEMRCKVENYEKKLQEVNDENKVLKTSVRALEENVSLLSDSYNDLEQYSRRECVEIKGIPTPENLNEESTNQITIDIGKLIGIDIAPEDISVSHRLPTRRNAVPGRSMPIIVKFVRRVTKAQFYGSRKLLQYKSTLDLGFDVENKIYISESLTDKNKDLFYCCLKVKKELKYKYLWTSNGRIFFRKDMDSKPLQIKDKYYLEKLK